MDYTQGRNTDVEVIAYLKRRGCEHLPFQYLNELIHFTHAAKLLVLTVRVSKDIVEQTYLKYYRAWKGLIWIYIQQN